MLVRRLEKESMYTIDGKINSFKYYRSQYSY
jgi:hypothetical protein